MALLDVVADAFSDLIAWIGASLLGILGLGGKTVYRNRRDLEEVREELDLNSEGPSRIEQHEATMETIREDLERHEGYWTGDPDDPSQPGALEEIHEIREAVDDPDD